MMRLTCIVLAAIAMAACHDNSNGPNHGGDG